jgi:hypothetical protein
MPNNRETIIINTISAPGEERVVFFPPLEVEVIGGTEDVTFYDSTGRFHRLSEAARGTVIEYIKNKLLG